MPLPLLFGPPFEILREPMDAFLYNEEVYRFISINCNRVRIEVNLVRPGVLDKR